MIKIAGDVAGDECGLTIASNDEEFVVIGHIVHFDVRERSDNLVLWG